jgi:hypothetical protein
MSRFTLDADAAALSAALLVAIASAIVQFPYFCRHFNERALSFQANLSRSLPWAFRPKKQFTEAVSQSVCVQQTRMLLDLLIEYLCPILRQYGILY